MTRFRGIIGINRGFVESSPGVQSLQIEEKEISGEIRNLGAKWPNAGANSGITMRQVLSVIAPEQDMSEFTKVLYIVWHGRKWAVTAIEYIRPRVQLTLGGLYND